MVASHLHPLFMMTSEAEPFNFTASKISDTGGGDLLMMNYRSNTTCLFEANTTTTSNPMNSIGVNYDESMVPLGVSIMGTIIGIVLIVLGTIGKYRF